MPLWRRFRLAFAIGLTLGAPWSAVGLTGRVLDSRGEPVVGAHVAWFPIRSPESALLDETNGVEPVAAGEVRTDAEGRFRVSTAKPLEVWVRVSSPGAPSVDLLGPFDTADESTDLDVEVPAVERISGRVMDPSGKPIGGARVRVSSGSEDEGVLEHADTTSVADGRFTLDAPDGATSSTVRAAGYAAAQISGRTPKDFASVVLRRGGAAEGRLVDVAGKAVPHAIVVANDSVAVETDASGLFRFEALPEGVATFASRAGDALLARREGVRIRPDRPARVDLALAPSSGISGLVVDDKTRRPIAGARIAASRPTEWAGRPGREAGSARSDSRGRFRVSGLLSAEYVVGASRAGYVPSRVSGVAGPGSRGSISIALRRAGAVTGRVTLESGSPVAGARVRVVPGHSWHAMVARASGAPERAVFSGRDGTFRLRGLTPTPDVEIEASHEGFVAAKRSGLNVRSGETVGGVSLVLRRGIEARGRVVDAQGAPISGAEVRLSRTEVSASRGYVMDVVWDQIRPAATSGADGRFSAKNLEAGQYSARVSHAGYATKSLGSLEAVKKEGADWAPFILLPSAAIAGTVRNTKGEPVAGIPVGGFTDSANSSAVTDSGGRFRLEDFQTGQSVFLHIWTEGYSPIRQTATAPTESLVITLTTTATVKGRVEDAESKQAVETFRLGWHTPRSTGLSSVGPDQEFHGADGSFELPNVRPGKVELEGKAEGYLAGFAELEVGEGETKEGVVLSLRKGKSVSGVVLDPVRGTGVANATVSWTTSDGGDGRWVVCGGRGCVGAVANSTMSDSDGKFSFVGLTPGRLRFTASHPDFLEASRTVDVSTETSVELTLAAGGTISGSVLDASSHRTVAGASISLLPVGQSPSVSNQDERTSDAAGAFQFTHLKEGRYRLTARSSGGQSAAREVTIAEGQSQGGVELEIASGTLVRGHVSGLPAEQLGGVTVGATNAQPGIGPTDAFFARATSDEQGKFLIPNVPGGPLRLQARSSWPGRSVSKNVEIPAGAEELPVEIAFTGSSRLSGRVTRHDRGVSSLHALADPRTPAAGSVHGYSITDADGRFSFEGLTDGEYDVTFDGEGVSAVRAVTVDGDTTLDVSLPSTTVSGIVSDAASGDPLEGVTVTAENGKNQNQWDTKRAVSDSTGRYTLTDLDPGSYQLTARKDGFASKSRPETVGDASLTVDFALTKANGLALHVFDGATGLPLAGVSALAVSAEGATLFTGAVSLDGNGRGEIASLGPGSYVVRLFSVGYAPRQLTAEVPGPLLETAMGAGGRVEVRAETSVTGKVFDAAGRLYVSTLWRTDGTVNVVAPLTVWDNFAPGSYELHLPGTTGDRVYPFTVTEGRTTSVEIK
jgi:5-hydroxyisourate hydrolase-like protein (transthyretin family)